MLRDFGMGYGCCKSDHFISFGASNPILEENVYICDIEIDCFLYFSCIGNPGKFL